MTLNLANNEVMKIDVDKSHNGRHITAGIEFCGSWSEQYLYYSDSLLILLNNLLIKNQIEPKNK